MYGYGFIIILKKIFKGTNMSKILNQLKDDIYNELMDANFCGCEPIISGILEGLGENTKRMMEIGLVQDELVKLGFENFRPYISCFIHFKIMVDFDMDKVILVHQNIIFEYTSPTWQADLINKVKELIK